MRDRSVLIIDDEKRMADSLRDLLAGAGYHCHAAYGGREGLDRLRRQRFDVIVTDLRMQDTDGLDVIRFARQHAPRSLVIVVTAYASTESAIEACRLQVFDYLRKPFAFEHLRTLVEKAFQKLETDRLREDTAAMITHDIKIPLTSIIGFASMLYDREHDEFHPRAREFADAIQTNGQKILALIENYLTTCKIEAGTLQLAPVAVDLRQLVLDVVETARLAATRRGVGLACEFGEIPETICVDEPLLYRALGNLVQNAIKYSPAGERVTVRAARLGEGGVRLETLNSAPLAAPSELDGLFERYRRVGGQAGGEGCGLGLYVVRAIAHAHGGEVRAELLEGGLIRFTLDLPLAPTEGETCHVP